MSSSRATTGGGTFIRFETLAALPSTVFDDRSQHCALLLLLGLIRHNTSSNNCWLATLLLSSCH
jgi:hypothetical protein